jgi:hypothetical protein
VVKAQAPILQRLTPLLRLAAGETAPAGPAAERAKTEAMKLLRSAEARQAFADEPESFEKLRDLIPAAQAA